jgi:hypothetical protein
MEKEFVPYTLALRLKVLGFDEPCFAFYNYNSQLCRYMNPDKDWNSLNHQQLKNSKITLPDTHTAPTYSQAFRWFRKKQEIEGFVHKSIEGNYYFVIKRLGNNESNMYEFTKTTPKTFDTYEEAEIACLEKLIEIVESKKE